MATTFHHPAPLPSEHVQYAPAGLGGPDSPAAVSPETVMGHPEDAYAREAPTGFWDHQSSQGQPRSSASEAHSETQPQPYYHVFRCWKWEVSSIGLAIGLIVALVVIITQYDSKRIDNWEFPINLPTLLALIATVLRIIVLVPLTSIISHSKWNWDGEPRSLKDYQDLDMASRGPWGAITALPLMAKKNIPALIAIIISLLTLATAPFVQQAMDTVPCDYETSGLAAVPYAHFVPNTINYQSLVYDGKGKTMTNLDVSQMLQACTSNPDPSSAQNRVQFDCATGNCTFPDGDPTEDGGISHSTIGVCHRCFDTSSFYTDNGNSSRTGNYTLSLPNGAWLESNSTTRPLRSFIDPNLTWAGGLMDTPEMRRLHAVSVANVTTMAVGEDQTFTAATCTLYTCMRTYKLAIQRGVLVEQELPPVPASYDLATGATFSWGGEKYDLGKQVYQSAVVKTPCRVDGATYTERNMSTAPNTTQMTFCEIPDDGGPCQLRNVSAPEPCIYREHGLHTHSMANEMRNVLQYYCHWGGNCDTTYSTWAWISRMTENIKGLRGSYPASRGDPPKMFDKIEASFRNFTRSVSQHYRMDFGAQTYRLGEDAYPAQDQAPGRVAGRQVQTTSCYAARVPWLALPASLLALTAALLAWVMARSWGRRGRQPVWKETLLPLVLYRDRLLPAGIAGEGRPLMEEDQMTDLAAAIPARFQWAEAGDGPAAWGGEKLVGSVMTRGSTNKWSDVDSLLLESEGARQAGAGK